MFKKIRSGETLQKKSTAIIETVVLTIACMILSFLISADLSYFSVLGYLCLLIGPLLAGLRYGFTYALNSALFIIGSMWATAQYYPIWNMTYFSSMALGLVIIPMITGEFRNHWEKKLSKSQVSLNYVEGRLAEVTNAFNILKISHERLAQRTASQSTLRDNIIAVRTLILKANSDKEGFSALILKLFADYCSIQQAGLYAVNDSGKNIKEALAFYGGKFEINSHDLVIKEALNTLKTTSLKPELATKEEYNGLILLAIPLVDVSGRVWGIVVVNKMPYRAFRPDNIRLFAILGGYIADLIGKREDSSFCEDIRLQGFVLHLQRCVKNLIAYDIPSCLVVTQIKNKKYASGMSSLILERQRGLDRAWAVKNREELHYVFILLPLTKITGTYGYKLRLQQIIKEQYDYASLEAADIEFYKKNLTNNEDIKVTMFDFFQKFNIDPSCWQKNENK